jgi:hypothetical protein
MTTRNKQIFLGIVVVIVILAILFARDHSARNAFRGGFDSTAGSPTQNP